MKVIRKYRKFLNHQFSSSSFDWIGYKKFIFSFLDQSSFKKAIFIILAIFASFLGKIVETALFLMKKRLALR